MATRNKLQRISCPFEMSMDLLSGKWKGMIIFELKDKCLRFSELQKHLPGVSNRMLSTALKELEEYSLVTRSESDTKQVNYQLTKIGHELIPAFLAIREWGIKYQSS